MAFEIVTAASAQGAVDRPLDAKLSEWVSLLDYYDDAVDQGDYAPALTRALAASTHVRIPSGSYTFNSPVDYIENMNLVGPGYPLTDGAGGAVITANNGFLKNPTAGDPDPERRRFLLSNLEILGDGTAVCIDGPFGGRIENCFIRGFTNGVRNNNSFLSRYVRTSFRDCTIGINLATANACRIEDCLFGADCLTAVDLLGLAPLPDGQNSGTPIIICGNNVNMSNASGAPRTAMKLRGVIAGYGNYFEDFTPDGATSGNVFVELIVNRFENAGFTWVGNEMNGQGEAAHAFLINGSHALTCDANGVITANRMIGFTGNTIEFGANNRIENLRIFDNNSSVTVGNLDPRATCRPLAQIGFNGAVSIAGSTFVPLPITQTVALDTANGATAAANTYRVRKAGYHKLIVTLVFATTSLDYPDIQFRIQRVGAGTLAEAATGLVFSSGTTHATASLSAIVHLAVDDDLQVQARNGENAVSGALTVEYLGNGSS